MAYLVVPPSSSYPTIGMRIRQDRRKVGRPQMEHFVRYKTNPRWKNVLQKSTVIVFKIDIFLIDSKIVNLGSGSNLDFFFGKSLIKLIYK